MSTNQKDSARIRNKRRVNRVLNHLRDSSVLLLEMYREYEGRHKTIEEACVATAETIDIIYNVVENIQAEI